MVGFSVNGVSIYINTSEMNTDVTSLMPVHEVQFFVNKSKKFKLYTNINITYELTTRHAEG